MSFWVISLLCTWTYSAERISTSALAVPAVFAGSSKCNKAEVLVVGLLEEYVRNPLGARQGRQRVLLVGRENNGWPPGLLVDLNHAGLKAYRLDDMFHFSPWDIQAEHTLWPIAARSMDQVIDFTIRSSGAHPLGFVAYMQQVILAIKWGGFFYVDLHGHENYGTLLEGSHFVRLPFLVHWHSIYQYLPMRVHQTKTNGLVLKHFQEAA